MILRCLITQFDHFGKLKVTRNFYFCKLFASFVCFRYLNFFYVLLSQAIIDDIKDNKQQKDIITDVRELSEKYIIPEHEVIQIVSILNAPMHELVD